MKNKSTNPNKPDSVKPQMGNEVKVYHSNGNLKSVGFLLNGKKEGIWESYHDIGTLEEKGSYLNGHFKL